AFSQASARLVSHGILAQPDSPSWGLMSVISFSKSFGLISGTIERCFRDVLGAATSFFAGTSSFFGVGVSGVLAGTLALAATATVRSGGGASSFFALVPGDFRGGCSGAGRWDPGAQAPAASASSEQATRWDNRGMSSPVRNGQFGRVNSGPSGLMGRGRRP